MHHLTRITFALIAISCTSVLHAQVLEDAQDVGKEVASGTFWMPYIFKTEAMEDGLGLAYNGGLFEGSGSLFAAAYGTRNSSWGAWLPVASCP